jgi:hypothetical protein
MRNRYCSDCGRCRIEDEDESSFDARSVSSTATMDNLPGPGRGLDQLFQYLGRRFDRSLAIGMDKLGFGPAATERRALKSIKRLPQSGVYRIKVVRGMNKIIVPSPSEIARREMEVRKCCKKLAKYLRFVDCA